MIPKLILEFEFDSLEGFDGWNTSDNFATVAGIKWPKQPTLTVTSSTERDVHLRSCSSEP